ncbi:hypothetical protein [Sinobacterium norvegicum]|uniref:hypothetical protein n=1 Tax=Sinobacterium norvegicum TaxID=1641715 RepID=UPI001F19FDA7|nr:hypothetical protein [Sinobacterium norvegicum]
MKSDRPAGSGQKVQLEIDIDKLEALFVTGQLCASELRCLNGTTKARIWNLCLKSCHQR